MPSNIIFHTYFSILSLFFLFSCILTGKEEIGESQVFNLHGSYFVLLFLCAVKHAIIFSKCFVTAEYLTIILRNRAEYRLILSRRSRRPSRLKSDDIPRD